MACLAPLSSAQDFNILLKDLNDAAQTYNTSTDPASIAHRQIIINKARSIMQAATAPAELTTIHSGMTAELVAVRTLMSLKVLHCIPPTGSASLHDLAEAVNAQESLIERLLRMTVVAGFLTQNDDFTYSHTKFSYAYITWPGPGLFFQLMYDEGHSVIARLHEFLAQRGLKEPEDPRYSPYTWTEKADGLTFWSAMARNPDRFDVFQTGMAAMSATNPSIDFYDFGRLMRDESPQDAQDRRPLLVDVGGGQGHTIAQIMKDHPELPADRFVLQDLPDVIEHSRKTNLIPDGAVRMAHDFMTPQVVKGAKSYLLRRILHDYASPQTCHTIIANIAAAMSPDSVLLISDYLFEERVQPGELHTAALDIIIMSIAGKERSIKGFRELIEGAGLVISAVYRDGAGSSIAVIEARLPEVGTQPDILDP